MEPPAEPITLALTQDGGTPITGSSARGLFSASRSLLALDHFRIPYESADSPASSEFESLVAHDGGARLLWPKPAAISAPMAAASLMLGPGPRIPIFGRVLTDPLARTMLARVGGRWAPAAALTGSNGERLASVWRAGDGSVFLPFDPDELQLTYLTENYRVSLATPAARAWRHRAMVGYYRARNLMPRPVQIWLRRRYARLQARTQFPRWPVEPGMHDLMDLLLSLVQSITPEPVPLVAPWPNGYSWAFVLTHDVETAGGLAAISPVLELEQSHGLRSCWNFVAGRYEVGSQQLRKLASMGFEVGVHGLYHDGRDLESSTLAERLPGMRAAAERWNAVGFRSPATHRDWALMPTLGFDYDSSYPDTDPFEPQGGGCCTWLPFFNRGQVELPLTMPQDHTLFVILGKPDERMWVEKAELLRARGGMALFDTHPDYLTDGKIFDAYRRLLERFACDRTAWRPLPREVADWWRRRGQSRLIRRANRWHVLGPAAGEARVEFAHQRSRINASTLTRDPTTWPYD